MRAVVYDRKGVHGMAMAERPLPSALPTQVLVRVHAASLNPIDFKLPKLPVVGSLLQGKGVCLDGSGVVSSAGSSASSLPPGTAVFGHFTGALGEYALADVSSVAVKPEAVSHEHAATVNVAALTSLQALVATGMKAGDSVLVVGGSGGCGSFGIQIAKLLGAGKVTTVCGDSNLQLCKELGADVVASYSGGDNALIAALQAAGPFDCCYDTVTSADDPSYERITRTAGVLKPGAMHVAINGSPLDFMRGILAAKTGLSFLQRANFSIVLHSDNSEQLAQVAAWMAEGKLKPVLDCTQPFTSEGVKAGYDRLVSRRARGKVVVTMG